VGVYPWELNPSHSSRRGECGWPYAYVDPYIPHYQERHEFCSSTPYSQRHWLDDLRSDGCHRVILVEEIAKALLAYGVDVNVFELEPTFDRAHHRVVEPHS